MKKYALLLVAALCIGATGANYWANNGRAWAIYLSGYAAAADDMSNRLRLTPSNAWNQFLSFSNRTELENKK